MKGVISCNTIHARFSFFEFSFLDMKFCNSFKLFQHWMWKIEVKHVVSTPVCTGMAEHFFQNEGTD